MLRRPLFFERNVIAQKTLLVRLQIRGLRNQFLRGRFRNRRGCPDLAMGMRVAGAHHGATIFENLYVVDEVEAA